MRKPKFKLIRNLHTLFILLASVILVIELGMIALLAYLFDVNELMDIYLDNDLGWFVILIWIVLSITIGLLVSFCFAKIIMKPVKKIIEGMTQLADGLYDTTIDLGSRSALKELSECFNKLASELQKNEMLSIDFVNNFSHELKTPLVSINGLISLMKQPNFPEEKKMEYLNIIEEESTRLASLTTNILNLSKLESQKIVTNKEKFNLSEQIRNCVLMFEKQWEKKHLKLILDFDEYYIVGNEGLLKQVWVNLIENAMKFSYDNSNLEVDIEETDNDLIIRILNEADNINEEDINKIFTKFYQIDKNKYNSGNGIGLSLVKKIVELHNGSVNVSSKDNIITVSIRLAKDC